MLDKQRLSTIGQRIKNKREDMDITQQALGEKLGLGKSAISKIESGEQIPKLEQILGIADTLKIRLNYILGLDNIPDIETEWLIAAIKLFSEVTTTKEHSANNKNIYATDDLIFQTNEDYLMLTGNENLFKLIKAIAKAENLKAKSTTTEYNRKITNAKGSFQRNKGRGKDESYFLISGEQMTEIIDAAIRNEQFLKTKLHELDTTTLAEDYPICDL